MIIPNPRNPAFVLFHTWWAWEIPAWATVSKFAREEFGLSLPPDRNKAMAIMGNMERCQARAFEMAQLVYNNAMLPVNMTTPTEAKELYITIMEHMAMWVNQSTTRQLIHRPIPIEGLREFNALANKIFPVAHRYGYYKEVERTMSTSLQLLLSGQPIAREEHRFNDQLIIRLEAIHRAQTRQQRSIRPGHV